MSNGESSSSGPQYRAAPLLISAAMVGTGTVIVLAGLAVGGAHLLAATRQWVNEMEVPPSELARMKWAQARAADERRRAGLAEREPGGSRASRRLVR